jgi:predicted dehydrogenase
MAVRFGVIGSGMMGREHIANLKLISGVEVVALCDPEPQSLRAAASMLPGEVHMSHDVSAMLAEAPLDAVVIASPNYTHLDVVRPLIGSGVHILCEKPLATNVADAREMVDLAARHNGVFWVGMEYRFMPPATEFISQVHAGRAGRVVMLTIREHRFPFLVKVANWNRFSENTGGTMVEKCCHFFDLMRHILQAEPVRVFCSGGMDVNHQDERYDGRKPDIMDNAFTIVDFDNGARATLDLCMFADGASHQEEINVCGDAARLDCLIPPGDIVHSPRVGFTWPKKPEREHVAVDRDVLDAGHHHGATYFQLKAFLDAALRGAPVQVTAHDGLMAVAMGAAAERSAKEKRVVDLKEFAL